MNPAQFHTQGLTFPQVTRRLWEFGITPDDIYQHILDHKHLVPIDAWDCLWQKHLSNPLMSPKEILEVQK